jgi:hypothetical protein
VAGGAGRGRRRRRRLELSGRVLIDRRWRHVVTRQD